MKKRVFGKSRGQIAVLYAGIIAVLLGAIGLSTDVAVMYVNWQNVRKAADAGALAGAAQFGAAKFFPTAPPFTGAPGCPSGNVEQAAGCTYALNNTAALSEITVAVPATTVPASVPALYASQTVQVTVNRTDIPVLFGRALGMTDPYQANVTAVAVGPLPLKGAHRIFPAGLPPNPNGGPITYGTVFSLTNPDGSWSPGNWGWLDLPSSSGANDLSNNITTGCVCTVNVGDHLTPKTGESWGQVQSAVSGLADGSLAPATLTGKEPQLVTVPIVSSFTNGSTPVTVLGFAEAWIIGISKSGSGQTLNVEFVKYVASDGGPGGGPNDYGAYSQPALVQ